MKFFRHVFLIGFVVLTLQPASIYATTVNTDYDKVAAAQVTIERLRKAPIPDWKAIRTAYDLCRPLVVEVDHKHKLTYQEQIDKALNLCVLGEKVKVNQQTLAKGLQHAVVLKISDLMQQMGTDGAQGRKVAAHQITTLFEGIRPTFTRRDKDFYKNREILEKQVDKALADLVKTSKSGGPDCFMAANLLKESINRTYALSLLFELLEIEKYRDTDLAKCDVKLAEAKIFYRIIEPVVKKSDRRGHRTITTCLKGMNYAAIDSGRVEEILNNSLSGGKIR